jgi:hypothetical protein
MSGPDAPMEVDEAEPEVKGTCALALALQLRAAAYPRVSEPARRHAALHAVSGRAALPWPRLRRLRPKT